jgi:hypothetical protein
MTEFFTTHCRGIYCKKDDYYMNIMTKNMTSPHTFFIKIDNEIFNIALHDVCEFYDDNIELYQCYSILEGDKVTEIIMIYRCQIMKLFIQFVENSNIRVTQLYQDDVNHLTIKYSDFVSLNDIIKEYAY